MIWLTAVVSLGGLAVAALALYLTYRERVASHRVALYTRQLDAYREIAIASATLASVTDLLVSFENDRDGKLQIAVIDAALNLAGARVRHGLFIADAVFERIMALEDAVEPIAYPKNTQGFDAPATRIYSKDPAVTVAHAALVDEMRKQVGTDKLSEEMLRLLGSAPRRPSTVTGG